MSKVHGIVYAYHSSPRLGDLTRYRTNASLPFCGRYRLIDFALSSLSNAGVHSVGVIMQRDYQSLLDHLGSGKAWDLSRRSGGLHLLRRQREQLSLRVRFLIEEYDIAARHQLLHLVAAWAEAGGVLTLHEDGKRVLRVVCTQYPTMSTLNWLETLSLVFTAFSCPYWEDAAETSFLMPNTSDAPSKLLAVPGDAPETPLNLLIRNIGDTAITTLTISAAGKISFQGLTLAPGAAIRIHHDAGVFAAEMVSDDSTVSILPYRTPESADDLLLRPGVLNEIRVEAGSAAFVSGRCKGRYC